MSDDHGGRPAAPSDRERSGAFVARIWDDERGLRARIRHTLDLPDPEDVSTLAGDADEVVHELVVRFQRWIEAFVARRR